MNLLHEIAKTGYTWTIANALQVDVVDEKRKRLSILLTVKDASGQSAEMHFPIHTDLTLERMVAVLMKKHFQKEPALRAWLDSKGNVPCKLTLTDEQLGEEVGYAVHVALRKLADSKQSVITWNAIHHLAPEDRGFLWKTCETILREQVLAKTKAPTRRNVATAFRDALTEALNNRRYEQLKDERGREVKRSEAEAFALLMLIAGVELTDIEEWMWGWLGYVLEDVAVEEGPVQEATTTA